MSREIELPLKGMSINKAWQGKNYKTKKYKSYEEEILMRVNRQEPIEGWVEVEYTFGLNYYKRTDLGNLEKALTDCLVKADVIEDDRYIKRIHMEKVKTDEDFIEVKIESVS